MVAPDGASAPRVSAIVVTYRAVDLTLAAVESLKSQTVPVHEILVVDNDPERSAAEPLLAAHPDLRMMHADNIGYAPACNVAAKEARGDFLFFLNPDAAADPDCLEKLLAVMAERREAGIVAPQVLFPDRRRVNAGENQIHLSGIAWCGRYEEPPEDGPARPVLITTGAGMLVRTELYRRMGGYCDDFFLFYEDPDICLRAWLAGSEVWFAPRAVVTHHYTFGDDLEKYYFLERHRLIAILSTLRGSTLAVLAPLLVGTELALIAVSAHDGWLAEKLRAYRSVWAARDLIARRRRQMEAMRARPDAAIIRGFQARVDTRQIRSSLPRRIGPALAAYWTVAVAIVKALGR